VRTTTAEGPATGDTDPAASPAEPATSTDTAATAESWHADLYTAALHIGRGPLFLRRPDGWLLPLDVERWCSRADSSDMTVLHRCEGAVLDIGCGPGRLVAALVTLGRPVLGIDISPAAVARTVGEGGPALRRSVFDRLPGEGRWGTALLVDGNIGIGGDPRALLERVAAIVAPDGLALVEAAPADVDERIRVRLDDGRDGSQREADFPWARVGMPALLREASAAGWTATEQWAHQGRRFAALRRGETRPAVSCEPPSGVRKTTGRAGDRMPKPRQATGNSGV
jgi:SAM-dependent methyltransferase